jgi:hypothetical protein
MDTPGLLFTYQVQNIAGIKIIKEVSMKKLVTLATVLVILSPCVCLARQNTLYSICNNVLDAGDRVIAFQNNEIGFSENDLLMVQDAAKDSLKDLRNLMAAPGIDSLRLTQVEIDALQERLKGSMGSLAQLPSSCNTAYTLIGSGYAVVMWGVELAKTGITQGVSSLLISAGTAAIVAGIVYGISCLLSM